MEAEKDVYTAMLERQPSLRTIRTKVESRPEPSTMAITGSGSARYRANGGRAIGRGVNFDKDGNTPRSGGDGEMLGSIDSGTPNFFRDSLTLKDDAIGGRPISVKRWAYSALGSTPNTTENGYFNNDELADLLNIVHGKNGDDGYDADTPHDATRIALLHTPTFAQVNNMKAAAGTQEWEEAGHAFKPVEPSANKKRKSMSAPASAAKSKKPKSEIKQRSSQKDEVPLSKEEEAMKKMKAFSTRGSTLRTVEDEELLETLVDIHGAPLSKEMKKLCLKHNQRALALNHDHELAVSKEGPSSKKATDEEIHAKSRSWTDVEDRLVKSLVEKHGAKQWALIANQLTGKTQKQVYARWRDYLQPGLTTRPWAEFEENHLVQIQEVIGNQWAVLARLMPGRSPNAIKNKFHAQRRRYERKGGGGDDESVEEE